MDNFGLEEKRWLTYYNMLIPNKQFVLMYIMHTKRKRKS